MADAGEIYTDYELKRLSRKVERVYFVAAQDMREKMNAFTRKFTAKEEIYKKKLAAGEITQEQFDNWKRGQVFQGEQWKTKRAAIIETMTSANQVAIKMINGSTSGVFAFNANYAAYTIEKSTGMDFGFGLYDTPTVSRLIKDDPKLLPEWKINEPKDYNWNYNKVNNSITQGIIQGENLDQITKRLSTELSAQNKNTMKTFARTAMTGAQNAGRLYRYKEAQDIGIEVMKEWIATLDSYTRDSHADIDGEQVPVDSTFSNGCEYPGDPGGPPAEVYNCRCTMAAEVKKYPSRGSYVDSETGEYIESPYGRIDNETGAVVEKMTYRQWEGYKKSGELSQHLSYHVEPKKDITTVDTFQSKLGMAKTVDEVNELMNNQGWWQKGFNPLTGELSGPEQRANLTGCDLDSAKSIAASYEQIFTKYPQLKGEFAPPDAHPYGMKDNTYAWCYTKTTGKVQVNPKRYSNYREIVKDYEQDVKMGWHPDGTTAESIVTHEVGHAVDGLLARKGVLGGYTSSGEYRYASSSLQTTIMNRAAKLDQRIKDEMEIDRWLKDKGAIMHNVSTYATKNPREWFAECFSEYITSANPRVVATEFGKELEKLLRKLK